MKRIIHGLLAGRPLCGFSNTVPGKWPEGHLWTNPDDLITITCLSCKKLAEKRMQEKKQKDASCEK